MIKVLQSEDGDMAVLYDSQTMLAFGPVFEGDLALPMADAFLRWKKWSDHTVVRHTEWKDWLVMFHNVDVSFLCDCGEPVCGSVATITAYGSISCDCGTEYEGGDLLELVK